MTTLETVLGLDLHERREASSLHDITTDVLEDPTALESFTQEISDLAGRALSKNILQEVPLLKASWEHLIAESRKPRVVLCWDRHHPGPNRKLVGLFPIAANALALPFYAAANCFTDPLRFLGTPLVDPDYAVDSFSAFLDIARQNSRFPHLFLLHTIRITGPIESALGQAAQIAGWRLKLTNRHYRAALNAQRSWKEIYESSIRKKKRKEYQRFRRRLKENGHLQFEVISNFEQISDALAFFLSLEAAGWKGRKKTNLLARSSWTNFFQDFVPTLAEDGKCEIVILTLDGEPIASGILLFAEGWAWYYKTAFDESYAAYSPGVLLTLDITRYLCDRPDVSFADSCAIADHSMINHIWRERIEIADALLLPSSVPFSRLILRTEQMRCDIRHTLKSVYLKYKTIVRKLGK